LTAQHCVLFKAKSQPLTFHVRQQQRVNIEVINNNKKATWPLFAESVQKPCNTPVLEQQSCIASDGQHPRRRATCSARDSSAVASTHAVQGTDGHAHERACQQSVSPQLPLLQAVQTRRKITWCWLRHAARALLRAQPHCRRNAFCTTGQYTFAKHKT